MKPIAEKFYGIRLRACSGSSERSAVMIAASRIGIMLFTMVTASQVMAAEPAQFPVKPVRLVIGAAPGGTPDILARILAPKLAEQMGQPVVVDNRPGAAGNIGADVLAKAPRDGYTMMIATGLSTSLGRATGAVCGRLAMKIIQRQRTDRPDLRSRQVRYQRRSIRVSVELG